MGLTQISDPEIGCASGWGRVVCLPAAGIRFSGSVLSPLLPLLPTLLRLNHGNPETLKPDSGLATRLIPARQLNRATAAAANVVRNPVIGIADAAVAVAVGSVCCTVKTAGPIDAFYMELAVAHHVAAAAATPCSRLAALWPRRRLKLKPEGGLARPSRMCCKESQERAHH